MEAGPLLDKRGVRASYPRAGHPLFWIDPSVMDFSISASQIWSLLAVIGIDIALAGDNAVVIGMAAAGLPPEQRRRAIILGIGAAAVLRIIFALITAQLLQITELLFAGGLLLLYGFGTMIGPVLGAVLMADQSLVADERLVDVMKALREIVDNREDEHTDDNDDVFDMAHRVVNLTMRKYGLLDNR